MHHLTKTAAKIQSKHVFIEDFSWDKLLGALPLHPVSNLFLSQRAVTPDDAIGVVLQQS